MTTATVPSLRASQRPAALSVLKLLPFAYAATLFVSATLLFLVQPMFAKMVLPLLGGTPAVWNTCVVFFQAALLLGYLYSHLATRYLSARAQVAAHLVVLLLPWIVLPVAITGAGAPPSEANPIPWLLLLLAVTVGLPFFVVSTSAPLLQRWFASTGHPSAKDPYFLYAASNLGSMLALLGYPLLIEPNLSLAAQSQAWAFGYGLLLLLVIGCVALSRRARSEAKSADCSECLPSTPAPTTATRLRWVALGLVPSSLMLGVTTHLTTDVAAIPLLWVLPLGLYLVTFILVFSGVGPSLHGPTVKLMPAVTLLIVGKLMTGLHLPLMLDLGLNLAVFFVIAMTCHGELARTRPAADHLTEFYLLISLGGVAGGLFNALVAPIAFDRSLEYPIVLALACMLLPVKEASNRWLRADAILPGTLAILAAANALFWGVVPFTSVIDRLGGGLAVAVRLLPALLLLLVCFKARSRPVRFGLAVGAVLLASQLLDNIDGRIRHRARGFFGPVAVKHDPARNSNMLVHGTTMHGEQCLEPALREEPATYYHRTGPLGQVFALPAARGRLVGIMGLGMGGLACYAGAGQEWTFYEIDPIVKHIAEDERYFSCLADARRRGAGVKVIMGDARLRLAEAPEASYDLLVLDVFSSDAVPVHLISHEAVKLYLAKLAPEGVLVFNISNHYLDLEPVLARVAREEGLVALTRLDRTRLDEFPNKSASRWVVMARKPGLLVPMVLSADWQKACEQPGIGLWRDDYSHMLGVFMWRER